MVSAVRLSRMESTVVTRGERGSDDDDDDDDDDDEE